MSFLRGTLAATAGLLLSVCHAHAGGTLLVSVDIDPRNCPNEFDPPNLGFAPQTLSAAVLGTDGFDPLTIQPSSLVLVVPGGGGIRGGGPQIPPIDTGIEDVSTPFIDPELCECTAEGADGFVDLTALFDAAAVSAALCFDMTAEWCPVEPGDEVPICLEGLLLDGTPFRGCDCILIIETPPLSVEPTSWGRAKALYR
jgi:hypothetical protein